MAIAVISFFLGILALNFFQDLPSFITVVYGIGCILIVIITQHYVITKIYLATNKPKKKIGMCLLLGSGFFICGFVWVWLHAKNIVDKWIPLAVEGKLIEVIGTVESIPDLELETVYFDFDIQKVIPQSSWPNPGRIKARWHLPPELRVGDVWHLSIRLKKPRSYSNPGSFDLERHFFQKGFVAEGTVIETMACKKLENASIRYGIDRFRSWLRNKLDLVLINYNFSGVVRALVIGMQDGILPKQWEVFRKTGTAHLVAISGLHVGLIASFVFFIIRLFSKLVPFFLFKIPISLICAVGSLIAATIYALLAGFSVTTKRALVMIMFLMVTLLQKRINLSFRGYLCALGIVLILDPLSILHMGFWLSFGAVGLILYGMKGRLNPMGLWWRWGRTQWLVSFGLAPLTLAFFNTASLTSPLANLVAIPWVSLVVVPFSLIGCICIIFSTALGSFFLKLANDSLAVLWPFLEKLSNIFNGTYESGILNAFHLFTLTIGSMLLLAPRGFPAKYIGLVWLLPALLVKPDIVEKNTAKVTVLDVGQGLACVVETQNRTLIFDTGPKLSEHFDTGDRVVLPYLLTRGINKVDALIISHRDNDHAGGAESLLQKLKINKIISSEKLFKNRAVELCSAGQHWQWDGVLFEMLHPSSLPMSKRNERSCVLRVQVGDQSVLFTADIEAKSEKLLIEKMPHKLASTVMIVPHHGSLSSSTIPFIRLVSPKYAIIPAGYLNRYGHPRQEIIQRYLQENITVFDTIKEGAISFTLNENSTLEITDRYRFNMKKYWHASF